jgi:hypothetical protein
MFSLKSWLRRWNPSARRPSPGRKPRREALAVTRLEDRVVPTVLFSEDFSDNNAGWTLGTEWQIGPATPSTGQNFGNADPGQDHTTTDDNGVAGVVIGGNAATTLHDYDYLTSPVINTASATSPVVLEFYRWLNSDSAPAMANRVEVFDGSSWQTVWQSAASVQDNSWQRQQFDVSVYKNANMRVRFGFNVAAAGGSAVSSWNLDDVTITSADPPATSNGLSVQIVGAPANSPEGAAITVTGSVADTAGTGPYAYAWSVTKNGGAYPTGTPTTNSSFTFTPDDNGTYVVNLTVTAADGRTATATSSTGPIDVLIIYDSLTTHTQALKNALEAAGMNVALSQVDETLYNGTNPSLTPYEAVIHLNGITWTVAMPTAGQQALVNYVQNGGAYIGSEWSAYEVGVGRMQQMRDLVLFDYQSERFGALTLTEVAAQASHPILANVPASVTFTAGSLIGPAHTFATNPVTVLMNDQFGNAALAVREFGAGRVVGFHNSTNYAGGTALSDAELQQLFIDGVRWAARVGDGSPGGANPVTITVTNVAPTGTMTTSGPYTEVAPVTFTFSNVTDPSPVDTAAGFRYSFSTSTGGLATSYAAASPSPVGQVTPIDDGLVAFFTRVFDKDGGFTDYPTLIQITSVAPTATITTGGPVAEGSPATVSLVNPVDSIFDRNSLRYSFATSEAELATSHSAAGTANSRQFTFADNGTYTVFGRVFDHDGLSTTYRTTVTVTNAAPTATITGAPANATEGTAITLGSTVTDPGTADTFTYAWGVTKNGAAYPTGTPTTNPTFTFTPDDNGTYVVTLTVTDDDGGVGVANSTGGPIDVLIIHDSATAPGTTALRNALQAAGMNASLSPTLETAYNGTNPFLTPYEAVIHLNGITWSTDMPAAGQSALVNYVQNGGGYIGSEWNAWEFGQGRLQGMRDLILLNSLSFSSGVINLTDVPGQSAHPILANIPSPASLSGSYNVGSVRTYTTQPATVLMRDQFGNDAVAVREFGTGRVVAFHNAGNYQSGTLTDADLLQLYVDGVRWAAHPSSVPGATITVTNVAPTVADATVTPEIDEGGTATVAGRVVDPGSADTHTVTISWGDGTSSVATVNPDRTFSASHVYRDDPPGASPDVYQIGIVARDDDGGTGGGGAQEFVTNGGFETGNFTGWTVTTTGSGQWVANNGAIDPNGPATPTAPISGQFDALGQQSGPSSLFLSEPIVVPANITSAVLSWSDRIRNHHTAFSDPNQEWRVRVLGVTGGVLREVFSTNPGDPLQQLGPNRRSFDLTSFFQGLAGQTVRLSFELQDNLFFFNVNLDDVSLLMTTGAGLTVEVNNVAPTLADVNVSAVNEGGVATLTGRIVDPGLADTHTLSVSWGDGASSIVTVNPDRTFSATHLYRDDNPTGTPSDVYQIGIGVRDDDGGGIGPQELVTNGGFESGFTGWTVTVQGGSWGINNGTVDPAGPGLPTAPISGTADALAQQTGPSRLILSEPITVPANITSAILSWSDRIRNHHTAFSDPNQEWRVRVLDASNNVLATVFSTNPGDPLQQLGPNRRSFDLTSLLQGRAGQTIRLSFEVEDNLFFFNVNLDDVSLLVTSGATPTFPVAVTNVAPTTPVLTVSPAVGEDGTVTVTGTFTDAGVDDTHSVTVTWGDGSQTVLGGGATVPVSQAVEFNGHRYYVIRQSGLSWFEAQEQAQRLGGNLVTINSAAENTFVSELLRSNFGFYALAWIGFNDERTEGQFEWVSGEPTTYTNWFVRDGEPNDFPPQVTEDFAITNYAFGFGPGWWNDVSGTRDSAVFWNAYAVVEVNPTRTFTLSHRYADDNAADAYAIGVTVTDDDTGTSSATATAAVTNSAPTGLTVTADAVTINEDGSVTLTGSFADRGTLDSHTVTIDWRDGTTSEVTVPAFPGTPSAGVNLAASAEFQGHTYHFISTRLSWDAAEAEARRMGGHLVTINSAAENLFLFQYIRRAAMQGDVQTWIGLSDGGGTGPFRWASGEALAYTNWAAGEPGNPAGATGIAFNFNNTQIGARWGDFAAETPLFAVIEVDGTRTFTATHRYLDDGPTGTPSDVYSIGVTVADDDGGTASASVPVTVNNVAPVIGSLTGPVAGTRTTATPGGAAVTFTGVRGQPLAFSTAFTDVGTLDTHEVRWDFGDGTVSAWLAAAGYTADAPAHAYAAAGTYTVTVTVRDDDGGTVSFAAPVEIKVIEMQTDPNDPTKTVLAVGGTTGADQVQLSANSGNVVVDLNGTNLGTFQPTGALAVYTQDGNDEVQVSGNYRDALVDAGAGADQVQVSGNFRDAHVTGGSGADQIEVSGNFRDAVVNAGAGNDQAQVSGSYATATVLAGDGDDNVQVSGHVTRAVITGGTGNDVLMASGLAPAVIAGGDGDDELYGSSGRSLLIGGRGADRITGGSGGDVLIAGYTAYDDDLDALTALHGVWVDTTRTYAQRVAALQSAGTLPGGIRLDASTVFHDTSADVLTGGAGQDWFLFDPTLDEATDDGSGEQSGFTGNP